MKEEGEAMPRWNREIERGKKTAFWGNKK